MGRALLALIFCLISHTIASSDERFIKKYAMMKIYESCFGTDVVKEIRREMKDAYIKCSASPSFDEPENSQVPHNLFDNLPPGFAIDPSTQTITKTDGAVHNQENELPNQEKIHQPKVPFAVLPLRSQPPFQPQPMPPYMMAGNQFRPYTPASPFFQYPYNPMLYSGLPYNPYFQQPIQQGFYQQPYMASNRMSREFDFHDRLDLVSRGSGSGKARNITCVMQELGYIDNKLEPNYEQITLRISNLPVSNALKSDIQSGLQYCQRFSECVPDLKRGVTPLWQKLLKPMFFFRCYKHKKLEACIMKDIRDRLTSEDDLDTDGDFRSLDRSSRSVKDEPLSDLRFDALDEMAVYLYDHLSGGSSLDYDFYL